jgi:hypothetical protein
LPRKKTVQREKEKVSGGCKSVHSSSGKVNSGADISKVNGWIEMFSVPVKYPSRSSPRSLKKGFCFSSVL